MFQNRFLILYKWRSGMLAWILHRITGLALIFYLSLHVFATRGLLNGAIIHEANKNSNPELAKQAWDAAYGFASHPLVGIMEILLLGAVLFHVVNGIRIMLIDFADGARYYKPLWYGTLVIAGILYLTLGGMMFMHMLHRMGGAA